MENTRRCPDCQTLTALEVCPNCNYDFVEAKSDKDEETNADEED